MFGRSGLSFRYSKYIIHKTLPCMVDFCFFLEWRFFSKSIGKEDSYYQQILATMDVWWEKELQKCTF